MPDAGTPGQTIADGLARLQASQAAARDLAAKIAAERAAKQAGG